MSPSLKPIAILNPRAAGGRAAKHWPRIARILAARLGAVEPRFTTHPGHATQLVRRALMDGSDLVIVVGGDGTINEAANGFLSDDEPINPAARLGIIPLGTGGDFQRTLRLPSDFEQAANVVTGGNVLPIDVGVAHFTGPNGRPAERYFVNLVSFGMGGAVSVRAKNFLTPLGGKIAFLYATLAVFLTYRAKQVRLTLDGEPLPHELSITNVAIGNGRFHGGGMHPCPRALLDDGLLEVTTIDHLNMFELIRDLPVLYSDDIYKHPKVNHYRAKTVLAEASDTTLIELDGEAVGSLPLEARILPRCLPVLVNTEGSLTPPNESV
ncbi:MAG TPA: diacylglycerol kinase family protein [Bryobacterales bacterium]|nr:diacylglycerol kinase family protein [Bryobacterales bacterium]